MSVLRGALVGICVVLSVAGCDQDVPQPKAEAPARPVEVIEVRSSDLPVSFEFVGRTVSSQRVEIRSRVEGFLDEISFDEGEFIEKGDPMFRIDQAPFEAKLRAAKAELAQQEARKANAEAVLARIEPLAKVDAVAQMQLDDATGQLLEAAAAVEQAAAGVYEAELNLGYTTIYAPVRGLTSSANEREGAFLSFMTGPLTYVARLDPIWVEFSVSEAQYLSGTRAQDDGIIAYPKSGSFDVNIRLADGSAYPHTGRMSFIDASISTSTGTFLLRAEIPNPDETLRPGQYVRVGLDGAFRPDAVSVPKRAVQQGQRGPYVWVVSSNQSAEQRPVQLGPWIGGRWVVEQGLRVGEHVVVNGALGLRPGALLNVNRVLSEEQERAQEEAGDRP